MADLKDPDDWTEADNAAWDEFRKRMQADPMVRFYPKAIDLKISKSRNFRRSFALWFEAVVMPFPLDLIKDFGDAIKAAATGTVAMVLGIASIVIIPLGTIFHRLVLTGAAAFGRLHVVPHNKSVAAHLNHRLDTVRDSMKADGYDTSAFFRYLDPKEITDENRNSLFRMWEGKRD